MTVSPFGKPHAAIRADRQDGADEMLVRPHPPGDAVHDDSETARGHCESLPRVGAKRASFQ